MRIKQFRSRIQCSNCSVHKHRITLAKGSRRSRLPLRHLAHGYDLPTAAGATQSQGTTGKRRGVHLVHWFN